MKRPALPRAALLLAALLPLTAAADMIGTYQMTDDDGGHKNTMTIQYKDDQHIRMETGQGNYVLITGARVYAVSNHKGKITAVDLDTMPKFTPPKTAEPASKGKGSMVKTGRTEVIAGIKGDVYEITSEDGEKMEAVMSSDKRAGALTRAFVAFAKRMSQTMGNDTASSMEFALARAGKGYGAILRANNNFVLQSLKEASLPASNYQLPPGVTPTAMPKFPSGMGPGGQAGAPGQMQMDPATIQKMKEAMQRMKQQQGAQ